MSMKPDKRPADERQRARDDRERPDRRQLLSPRCPAAQRRARYGPYSPPTRARAAGGGDAGKGATLGQREYSSSCVLAQPPDERFAPAGGFVDRG